MSHSEGHHHHSAASVSSNNMDIDYSRNFHERFVANKERVPFLVNPRAENQYIWTYSRTAFQHGVYYGAFIGGL